VALALPLTLNNGEPFPHRDLILLVSFGVIFLTVVGIGSTLPFIARALGVTEYGHFEAKHEREKEIAARRELVAASRKELNRIVKERELPEGLARFLETRHEMRVRALPEPAAKEGEFTPATRGAIMVREIISIERKLLHKLLREGKITDETRRRIERDLDLEEAVVDNREKNSPV
jgi:CPA1 family monovalent cation:H+ antiporter